jgi:formate/nitrite transporter FocA (FNT family)
VQRRCTLAGNVESLSFSFGNCLPPLRHSAGSRRRIGPKEGGYIARVSPDAPQPDSDTSRPRPPRRGWTARHPREETLERSFDRIIDEGSGRLERLSLDVLSTGTVAGIEVAFGVLALLYVEVLTHNTLLGGLAFSIGFIGLLLGHSELFTEGFLVPVTVVAAGEARLRSLVKLWTLTLLGNLFGGYVMAWIITAAFPSIGNQAVKVGSYYVESGINVRSFCLAVLAGGAITLLTRMHQGTDSEPAKLLASISVAFLLAGLRLFHSVLDSILAFLALDTGRSRFGYLDWLGFFGWLVFGNVVGGLGLTTLLRLIRSRARLAEHRMANDLPVVPAIPATKQD